MKVLVYFGAYKTIFKEGSEIFENFNLHKDFKMQKQDNPFLLHFTKELFIS